MTIAHTSPEAMARVLVSYIADDERVLREVRSTFDSTMGVQTIRQIRRNEERAAAVLARAAEAHAPLSPQWDWANDQMRADMEIASQVFVRAIGAERTRGASS